MNAGCYKPITVETLEVAGLRWAFEAMRLPDRRQVTSQMISC